jgi:hypothetical protein
VRGDQQEKYGVRQNTDELSATQKFREDANIDLRLDLDINMDMLLLSLEL